MGRKLKRLVATVVLTATMLIATQSIALACLPFAGAYVTPEGRVCVKALLWVCK